MGKRVFFLMLLLFVFSFLFVQVSEAVEYAYTITKIGFHSSDTEEPDAGAIVDLPSPVILHEKIGEPNPNISEFIYQGNIPNGIWTGMSLYVTASTNPDVQDLPVWQYCGIVGEGRGLISVIRGSGEKVITRGMRDCIVMGFGCLYLRLNCVRHSGLGYPLGARIQGFAV